MAKTATKSGKGSKGPKAAKPSKGVKAGAASKPGTRETTGTIPPQNGQGSQAPSGQPAV